MANLKNAIDNIQTSVILTDMSGLPLYPNYYLKIDTEIIFVRKMVGKSLTIVRGVSPASHAANAPAIFVDTPTTETFYNPSSGGNLPTIAAGMVKSDGTTLAVATPGVDYLASAPAGSSLTGLRQLIYRFFSLAIGTSAIVGNDLTNHITLFRAATLKKAIISAKTAPTGAAFIIDILANGSTIWTTTANRLSLAINGTTANTTTFDVSSFSANTILSINIIQIGSTIAGQDIQVELELEISYP